MNMALDNQHAAQNQGVDIPTDADAAAKAVDVDLESGKAEDVSDDPPPQKPAASDTPSGKPPLPRPQARIQSLTHERDSIAGERDRLLHELNEARRVAAEERAARETAERAGMENLVRSTKAEVLAAEAALRAAKDAKDDEAEIAAQKRLARAVAEEADADAWAADNQKPTPAERQQPQPRQQQAPEFQPLAGPVRDFIAENPWFNAAQIGADGRPIVDRSTGRVVSNPDFDPEMHNIAMLEDQRIQREIRMGVLKPDFMGTPDYFERVRNRVMQETPDAFEPAEDPVEQPTRRGAPQMDAARQPVSPSNRQIPGQSRQQQGSKMRLSGEEADLVRSLVDNGTMFYPRDHHDEKKRGQKMTYQDAYVQYAKNKQSDQASRG
jgi:hypothetical protein